MTETRIYDGMILIKELYCSRTTSLLETRNGSADRVSEPRWCRILSSLKYHTNVTHRLDEKDLKLLSKPGVAHTKPGLSR